MHKNGPIKDKQQELLSIYISHFSEGFVHFPFQLKPGDCISSGWSWHSKNKTPKMSHWTRVEQSRAGKAEKVFNGRCASPRVTSTQGCPAPGPPHSCIVPQPHCFTIPLSHYWAAPQPCYYPSLGYQLNQLSCLHWIKF